MTEPRVIAFYLPQFHRIAENDAWWGEGFTEWVNVRRAIPLFEGHRQPAIPGRLGYYDLEDPDVLPTQWAIAERAGLSGFCFYFYWFDGQRLLERPLERLLAQSPGVPHCLSWANENWTRRWDGKDREILIAQRYDRDTADRVFSDMLPHLTSPDYLRMGSRPILVVHRADHIPSVAQFVARWRELAARHSMSGLYLVAAETSGKVRPEVMGFDAGAEFPPVGMNDLRAHALVPPPRLKPDFRGRLFDYGRLARRMQRRPPAEYLRHHGVMPSWDNTARRGRHATVYLDATPEAYEEWLKAALEAERLQAGANGLVFINAWNEWAEGAYLEPDTALGEAYLDATRRAITVSDARPTAHSGASHSGAGRRPSGVLSPVFLRSVAQAAAASAKRRGQAVRGAISGERA